MTRVGVSALVSERRTRWLGGLRRLHDGADPACSATVIPLWFVGLVSLVDACWPRRFWSVRGRRCCRCSPC
ncbi:hypothetical protein ACRAWD_09800 [Caulobacter segnis]